MALHVLHHHDGVIHHDADGQHQSEQRQCVQRETEHVHHRERADQRDRHGDQRDDRRAPGLQEQHHHDHHQEDGLQQRDGDGLERGAHEDRGVVGDPILNAVGELSLKSVHCRAHRARHIQRVRARALDDLYPHRRLAIEQAAPRVGIGPHRDAGDIPQASYLAVGARLHDDLAELLLARQSAQSVDRDLERRRGIRLLTNRTSGNLYVLLADGGNHVARDQPTSSDLGGFEPDPHRILPGAPD